MFSEKERGALDEMLHNILLAEQFASGHTRESLHTDQKTLYAVIRCLEILSEASRRLTNPLKVRPLLRATVEQDPRR